MLEQVGLYFGARALTAALGLLAVAAYSRLLEPAVYGVYALVLTSAMMTADVLFHWIRASVVRLLPNERKTASAVLGTAMAGFGAVGAVGLLATAVVAAGHLLPGPPGLVLLGGTVVLGLASFEIALAVVQARRKAGLYLILTICRALGSVALGVLLVVSGLGAWGPLIGLLLATSLPVLALVVLHARTLRASRPRLATAKLFASYGLPFVVVSIAGAVIAASDRYLIAALVGMEEAGVYAAAYDFTQRLLFMVMAAAFLAFSPAVIRSHERGETVLLSRGIRDQVTLFLVTALPIAVALVLTAPLVARVVFGPEFRAGAEHLLPWLAVGTLLQGVQAFFASYYFTLSRRTATNAWIVLGGAMLNITLNLLLIPSSGAQGAAVATVLSYAVVLLASVAIGRRWVSLPWPVRDTVAASLACAGSAPLLIMAAGAAELAHALSWGAAAGVLLALLLLAFDVGGSRRTVFRKIPLLAATAPHSRADP
jgi:O-antigen/teichoic acid export membrane protein